MPTVSDPIALTSLAGGAGCGCKLPASDLLQIVLDLPAATDPRVLVGTPTGDDAAVFALSEDLALVQTVDFFTPLVDDPYDFGRIAAANALSDVYAMGGLPITAMNVVAFPLAQLGGDVLAAILRGGFDVVTEAGASVVGGHSIRDDEPKYGMAVTGTVDPRRIVTNAGGVAGDVLVLTKPLGVGAIVTAAKRGLINPGLVAAAVSVMVALNAGSAQRGSPRDDRRHRLRPARPPPQRGARERPGRRDRRPDGAGDRRRGGPPAGRRRGVGRQCGQCEMGRHLRDDRRRRPRLAGATGH
jgi:selenide,water dikinase